MRLKSAMGARGLTKLSAMSAAVGVTESAICRWRQGGTMSIENVTTLCRVLDISIDWFLLGRGHMEQHIAAPLPVYPRIAKAVAGMKPQVREYLSLFLQTIQEVR